MEPMVDPDLVLAGVLDAGADGLGERLLRRLLTAWDRPGEPNPMVILVRSAVSHEESTVLLRRFVTDQLLGRLVGEIAAPDPELRASLVGSQLIGLVMARFIVRVEPLDGDRADPAAVPDRPDRLSRLGYRQAPRTYCGG
jgi:hypothetical protein